jgi:hypothetical protein
MAENKIWTVFCIGFMLHANHNKSHGIDTVMLDIDKLLHKFKMYSR